jgi:hypothetical protein
MTTTPRRAPLALVLLACAPALARAGEGLPLPPAPVRVLVSDVPAFETALTGAYRQAFTGTLPEGDKVLAGFRQSQVGAKVEAQWGELGTDVAWSWADVEALRPRRLGLALLSTASMEAVLVIDTPLVALPSPLPAGTPKTHAGVTYALVTRGAGDGSQEDRRMGLAWARHAGLLFLATSERALHLALDESVAGRGFEPALPGLVAMALDQGALGKDRYFRREFKFGATDTGRVDAALRLDGRKLVEFRQGKGAAEGGARVFDTPRMAAAAWEPASGALWPAIRAGLLEPIPNPSDKPVPALAPLPSALPVVADDRYLVSLEKPVMSAASGFEEGDLLVAREVFAKAGVRGFGYAIREDGSRLLVFEWPKNLMADLERACRATLTRRGGPVTAHDVQGVTELRFGSDLPALAFKRVGDLVWLGPRAAALADAPAVRTDAEIVRWARLDLRAVRAEGPRWIKAEGPDSADSVRPFADRILGILGWMPETTSLFVERRRSPEGWTERVEFGPGAP